MNSYFAALLGAVSLAASLLGACGTKSNEPPPPQTAPTAIIELSLDERTRIRRFIDPETGVTCYLFWSNAISCVTTELQR